MNTNVEITPPTVKVLSVSEWEECKKLYVTLVCVAERFYPDHVNVNWKIDGENRTTDVSTDEAATQGNDKFYSITSRLNVDYEEWTEGKTFTCIVSFYNGTNHTHHEHYIVGPPESDDAGKYVRRVKTTMLAYGVFVLKSFVYGLVILLIIKRQGFISK
ncbi:hypothetical protein PHYPO_G00013780 [Pangasianodon hypophthalmus]|uniref:Ig-like domain-containing protein n=1 Tax=Pangasianodon hypophthalmus TaxID=310915 RepID=A0A5N5N4K6_PANHP|nr:hypothetical protein PHYPO_G00013780 [Pangasianodon hypophthalmus]